MKKPPQNRVSLVLQCSKCLGTSNYTHSFIYAVFNWIELNFVDSRELNCEVMEEHMFETLLSSKG